MFMEATGIIDDPIRKFQSELKECMDRAERLRPIVKSCEEAIQRAESKATVFVRTKGDLRPKINVMLLCKRLDETVPLFRELAKEGLHTDKKKTHEDHNFLDVMAMREYNLGPDVIVTAMLISGKGEGDEGPTCRMEQVGVKEVPIYEMKCD